MSAVKPPYLGAAYYPEVWPPEQVDEDIALMKSAGMNVMRMAEFAWARMEPQDGTFDFAWLHRVVDKLGEAGIASVLGTPSAAPPLWLTEKYPEVLYHQENGTVIPHGSRVHFCPNNPVYRDYCGRMAEKMGREFGQDPNVIGWQVDNEVSYGDRPCVCKVCQSKFHQWLERRFGSVAKLNDAWVTDLWSQTYAAFTQIPIPRKDVWHHPSLLNAWAEFGSDSYVEYVKHQADVLHKFVKQPVGTDMMVFNHVDYHDMHQSLDLVQHNHYHHDKHLHDAIFWFDYCRSFKPAPFWCTETATCWNGATTANGYKEPGFCRANTWLPIALGGEANFYWLWRQHLAGQELMHGAVVTSQGRPLHIMGEVQEIARGFRKAQDFLNGTRPLQSGLAIHFSNKAHEMYAHQPIVNKFNYAWGAMEAARLPLIQAQFRPDSIAPAQEDLSPYRVIFSPFLPMLDEGGLRPRLKAWIEAGGTWIAGPMTDIRDLNAAKFPHSPYGSLEDWAGARVKVELPGDPRQFAADWGAAGRSQGQCWYDGLEAKGAKVLAKFTEGPLKGLAAATQRKMGKGTVVLLGTLPEAKVLQKLFTALAKPAGVGPVAKASESLLVVPRKGEGGEGLVVVEYANKPAFLQLERPAMDLISGKKLKKGKLAIERYGVRVLKYL